MHCIEFYFHILSSLQFTAHTKSAYECRRRERGERERGQNEEKKNALSYFVNGQTRAMSHD